MKVIKSPMTQHDIYRSFIRSLINWGFAIRLGRKGVTDKMETTYIEFDFALGNGEKCTVRYCDAWGVRMFGNRTIHFEFLKCYAISRTLYRSEFRVVGVHEKINPKEAAKQIIERLTGIKFSGENVQQKLLDTACATQPRATLPFPLDI